MSIVITVVLVALAAYFSWLVGRRYERGLIEMEEAAYQDAAAKRAERSGHVRMSTMKVRR